MPFRLPNLRQFSSNPERLLKIERHNPADVLVEFEEGGHI
jgi:hypothetical protein